MTTIFALSDLKTLDSARLSSDNINGGTNPTNPTRRKRGRPRKATSMTPTTNTAPETPAAKKTSVRKSFFDLESMKDVTLIKEVEEPGEITDPQSFITGLSAEALTEILNYGNRAKVLKDARSQNDGWKNGEVQASLDQFTEVDSEVWNGFVNVFLKMGKKYDPSLPTEEKRKLRAEAADKIKKNTALIEQIKAESAEKSSADEDEDENKPGENSGETTETTV